MTDLRQAAQQALEALEGVLDDDPKVLEASISGGLYEVVQCRDAINTLRTALEQPQQEPMAKVVSTAPDRIWLDLGFDPQDEAEIIFDDLHDVTWSADNASGNGIEYVRATPPAAQRTWVGLTDAEFLEACQLAERGNYLVAFQRIQQILKAKNDH
jgi:hypothetical protein